jgi:hypothetical protein
MTERPSSCAQRHDGTTRLHHAGADRDAAQRPIRILGPHDRFRHGAVRRAAAVLVPGRDAHRASAAQWRRSTIPGTIKLFRSLGKEARHGPGMGPCSQGVDHFICGADTLPWGLNSARSTQSAQNSCVSHPAVVNNSRLGCSTSNPPRDACDPSPKSRSGIVATTASTYNPSSRPRHPTAASHP